MISRIPFIFAALLILAGCARPQEIQKEALLETTRHWKEPKAAIWYYVGSKEGRDYFSYLDVGIEETFSVESGQIAVPHSFPFTKDQKVWLVMPWGPAALTPMKKEPNQTSEPTAPSGRGSP